MAWTCGTGDFTKAVSRVETELKAVSAFLHANPELGLEEHKAADALTAVLKGWGFSVERPVAGLDTAFKASWGEGSPVFCFMSEYDALPGIGHACGHNLIAVAGLAAAYAAKAVMEERSLKGSIVLMGTPGEEGKSGKVIMAERGAFKGVDACLISHPYDRSSTDDGCLSVSRFLVSYRGVSSHASVSPELGVNALDSVIALFNSVNAWRQHLPESSRVHGVITHGGEAPNVIPDFAEAFFYVRAADSVAHASMEAAFARMAEAAALSTGAKAEVKRVSAYKASVHNGPLNDEYLAAGNALGLEVAERPPKSGRGSTDFGDVSQLMPGANLHFGIVEDGHEVPLHSLEFKEAAATPFAFSQAMKAAAAMAFEGVKYIACPEFRAAVDGDFRRQAR